MLCTHFICPHYLFSVSRIHIGTRLCSDSRSVGLHSGRNALCQVFFRTLGMNPKPLFKGRIVLSTVSHPLTVSVPLTTVSTCLLYTPVYLLLLQFCCFLACMHGSDNPHLFATGTILTSCLPHLCFSLAEYNDSYLILIYFI